ncbi:lipopolysaccharide assembly LapA domain-containing protein [Paenibacillus sp. Soil787]|uniref:LapA family protein n=1 Tax=Paenibacillus sp. Soil787 TaxID=1736411 RepID=UPI0009EAA9C3|nr:lipopolysaccharide assembly protein LapA domain-containing protein [Paenibacillus sp. Soil787]
MKMQWILISALVFALITAVFAVINVEPVQVNFMFAQTSTPLILVILTSTLLGGLIVGLFGMVRQYKLQRKVRQLEKQLQDALFPSTPPQPAHDKDQTEPSGSTVH